MDYYKITFTLDDNFVDSFTIVVDKTNNDLIYAYTVEFKSYNQLYNRVNNAIKFLNDLEHLNIDLYLKGLEKILNIDLGCTKVEIVKSHTVEKATYNLIIDGEPQLKFNFNYDPKNECWYLNNIEMYDEYHRMDDQSEWIDLFTFIINNLVEYNSINKDIYISEIKNNFNYFLNDKYDFVEVKYE